MQKEFTKSDLKDGMVVEYRDGRRRLVVANMLIGEGGFLTLDKFRENLESIEFVVERTIVKIYKVKKARAFAYILKDCNLELIWEREETKRMTAEEMRKKLEELTGEKIEIEPSREEMVGACYELCLRNEVFRERCPLREVVNCKFEELTNEELKKTYEKVMEDGQKES